METFPKEAGRSRRAHVSSGLVALLSASAWGPCTVAGQGYRLNPTPVEFVSEPRMHERPGFEKEKLPAQLDWRAKDGRDYTTVSRNQHIPKFCGACYAFGTTSALSDRIRIAQGGASAEVNLAMQVVLNCDKVDLGCGGGDATSVYQWIHQNGVPDETCQPYEAVGHDTGRKCNPEDVCRVCDQSGCRAASDYPVYNLAQFGHVKGEHHMMAELQRGPIACAISTPPDFISMTGWDIYTDMQNKSSIDHIISVVGYGSENGQNYWILRNSWGTYWGYYGWARVARGVNNIHIEEDCAWATPSNDGQPTWRHVDVEDKQTNSSEGKHGHGSRSRHEAFLFSEELHPKEKQSDESCRVSKLDWAAVGGELVDGPRPHEELDKADLPEKWDWRNVSGQSFVTWNTNENAPHGDCSSCWAQGVAATLGDRIAVLRNGAWPSVAISPQMLINCKAGGSCNGGDPAKAYDAIRRYGVTDETCQNYQAEELSCRAVHRCMNCAPEGEHELVWPGTCIAVKNPIVWYVSQFGSVKGVHPMKAEIYKRGPIGCGLMATPGFRSYKGGVYSERVHNVSLNQQVSVAGWGKKDGHEFWVGRNSWGTIWGEDGWFRLQMHDDNLGVETDCDWAVPADGPQVPSMMLSAPAPAATAASPDVSNSLYVMLFMFVAAVGTVAHVAVGSRTTNDVEATEDYIRVE